MRRRQRYDRPTYLSFSIMKMHESGMMEKLKTKWLVPSGHCPDSSENSGRYLELDAVAGLFVSYLGVIGLACLCLVGDAALKSSCTHSLTLMEKNPREYSPSARQRAESVCPGL